MSLEWFAINLSILSSLLLPVSLYWYKYSRGQKEFRYVYALFWVAAVTDVVTAIMALMGIHNFLLQNGYKIVEFTLLFCTLWEWSRSYPVHRWVKWIGISVFAFSIFNFFYSFQFASWDIYPMVVMNTTLIVFAMWYLWKLSQMEAYLFQSPKFWFSFAILFLLAIGITLTLANELKVDSSFVHLNLGAWNIFVYINIITNCMYIYGIKCLNQQVKRFYSE